MQPRKRQIILSFLVFVSTLFASFLLINVDYKYLLAPLFAIVGVFLFRMVVLDDDARLEQHTLNISLLSWMSAFIAIQVLVAVLWLLVPPSTMLFFIDWSQLSGLLIFRGLFLILYSVFVPGILLAYLLDTRKQLSQLEIVLLGFLFSVFIASSAAYLTIASHQDITGQMLPLLWIISTLIGSIEILGEHLRTRTLAIVRPSSFPTSGARNLVVSLIGFLLVTVLVINASWHVLLGGDLWTHAAQTAYYLQGEPTASYPWTFHFFVAGIHATSGLPVVNVIQSLQFLAVMPVLALYVTISALVSRDESKIPAIGALFFAIFMGLGWSSYLFITAAFHPVGSTSIYGAEYIASELTYDILIGVAAYRVVLDPAIVALTALIYAIRLLGGFTLPRRLLVMSSFTAVVIMIQAHLLEVGFFTGVLLVAAIFLWDEDQKKVLFVCALTSGAAFAWTYLLDYVSPPALQIYGPFPGNFYYSGFEYALAPLIAALIIIAAKVILGKRWPTALDVPDHVYSNLGLRFEKLQRPSLKISLFACVALGVAFGLYTISSQPFFAWQTQDTGSVPWNYYPIRIGVVALLALLGSPLLFLNRDDFRRLFHFISLAVVAIIIGRLTDLFGLRPQGFGENRVMDFLWIGAVLLAAYGLAKVIPVFLGWLGSTNGKREIIGAILIILILLTGASSFLIFIDAYVENSATPGLVPTFSDMVVVNYIIGHRGSVGPLLTAPTFETQYWLRKLTLNQPYGYTLPFVTPSLFTSTTLPVFLGQMSAYSGLRVLLTAYDVNYLEAHGYTLSLWYLAYQPTLVDAGTSFLIASRALESTSTGSITIMTTQQPSQQGFFLASAFGLSATPYMLDSLGGNVSASTPSIILTDDPSSSSTYFSALSWVQATGRTLFVVSNISQPGLFESKFFGNNDENATFSAVSLISNIGSSFSYEVPVPFTVHLRQALNAVTISQYQGVSISSPLSYEKTFGSGRVILLMLRDYFVFLSHRMFVQDGRDGYSFLPYLLQIAGVSITP